MNIVSKGNQTVGNAKPLAVPTESARTAPGNGEVRIVCVDDHAVLVDGLKAKFSIDNEIRIIKHLTSAAKLLEEVARLKPHMVLLDIEMPGPDVFEMADRLRHSSPEIPFVFFSAHIRDGYLANAYKCGAWGYFAKGDELDDIVAGIKKISASTAAVFVMGPKVREHCGAVPSSGTTTPAPQETKVPTPFDSLTAREVEILRLIGKGLSRMEIGKELSRSAKTIDGHQDRMLKKLGITSRTELMRFAIRKGFAEA